MSPGLSPAAATQSPVERRSTGRGDWLDAFELPEFFFVVGCPVQVERELAVEPELGGGAECLGQPQGCGGVMPRLPLMISFSRTQETPIRSASCVWVIPRGLMNSSGSISPGGVGARSEGILTCAMSAISVSDSPRSRRLRRPIRSSGSAPATDR